MHQVIVVGGGPVGLTTSIALSQQNIPHVLFEKHLSTAIFPKAVGLNQRTIEYFRTLGLEEEIYRSAAPPQSVSQTTWYTSLGPEGKEIYTRDAWGGGQYADEYARASPCRYTVLPQIRLEPILHRKATQLNPDGIFNNATVVGVEEGPDSACVHVRFTAEGDAIRVFKAQYIVAADGGRMVADALGIRLEGERDVMEMVSGHIQAPISKYHPQPNALITWFIDPEKGGSINTGYLYHLGPYPMHPDTEEWLFACGLLPGESRKFTAEMMLERMHRTLNIPGLEAEVKLKSISHWNVNAVVAERYRGRGGRVFLVGDAAHRFPPWGALGLNTGLQDVQNLVWKLAMGLSADKSWEKDESDALLDTYETERRPIALRAASTSLTNLRAHGLAMDHALGIRPDAPVDANIRSLEAYLDKSDPEGDSIRAAVVEAQNVLDTKFHASGLEIGWFYPCMDLLNHGAHTHHGGQLMDSGEFKITAYHPSMLPGHHLPHSWLGICPTQVSILDILKKNKFVLLPAMKELSLVTASELVHVESPLKHLMDPVTFEQCKTWIGEDDESATLVRPDGIVMWRLEGRNGEIEQFRRNPDSFVKRLLISPSSAVRNPKDKIIL